MENTHSYGALGVALSTSFDTVIGDWLLAYRESMLRLPKPVDEHEFKQVARGFLESLSEALSPGRHAHGRPAPHLAAGSSELREVEKSVAFLGATLGSSDASGYDIAALVLSLRDVLGAFVADAQRAELNSYVEWLQILAVDSFSVARAQAARERIRDQLENGTPVVMITPELPATLLIGAPDSGVLDSIFGKLLLQVVRVGARAVIIDAAGLVEPGSHDCLASLERFLSHRKVAGSVELIGVGLDFEPEKEWAALAAKHGTTLRFEGHFDRAVAHALELSGYRLVRSPS